LWNDCIFGCEFIMKMKKAIIGIETLVDPLNLSIIFVYLLKVKGIKVIISNIDYLYLQSVLGGYLPDDNGVLSIDSIIKYAWEQIEINSKLDEIKRATDEKFSIVSSEAAFSMIYNLTERGYIELVDEKFGSIIDGISFLLTGNVEKEDPNPSHYFSKIYNRSGFIGDVLRWNTLEEISTYNLYRDDLNFLKKKYSHLPLSIINPMTHRFQELRLHVLDSRFQTVGISVRQNIPIVNSDSFFQEQLQKFIGRKYPKINKEVHTAKENVDINFRNFTVRDLMGIIDGSDQKVRFVDALYKVDEKFRNQREGREDFVIFLVNLFFGVVPYMGTAVSVLSYLYQEIKDYIAFRQR